MCLVKIERVSSTWKEGWVLRKFGKEGIYFCMAWSLVNAVESVDIARSFKCRQKAGV